jgi:hypothetical protein
LIQDPPTTIVGLMHVEFSLPLCNSLKDKRSALRPCIHHLRNELNLAVAEVADQARPASPKQPRVLTCPGRALPTKYRTSI